jgi:eukaryotic-like serine/threonine-protein kinase
MVGSTDRVAEAPNGYEGFVPRTLIDDRYELRGPVGSGGMADVFVAHDEVLDRDVALKLLKDHYAENEEFVERFKREARNAASLSHPNIVSIFDRGESEDGTYYIAMEYLPGGTLKDRILKRGALPPQMAAEVALQIAEALQAAHKRDIIHRDVKPRNILVAGSGDVKVTDFGIARAADATTISNLGDILGTAKYMSPEQAMGEPVGPASDLYSLGVVLYEMLTGRVPFEADTPADVSAKHADQLPPHPREVNPEVPEGMDALVMRLLARDPADRYGSATELIEELRRVREGLPPLSSSGEEATTAALVAPPLPTAAPGGTEPRRRRRRRLSWTLMAFVALIALLAAVGGTVGWNLWQDYNEGGVPGEAAEGARGEPPGTEEAKVPDVEGLTEQAARERLAGAGFEVEVRLREGPVEDAGRVLEQSVASGKEAEKGSKILLTVGEAPEVAKVPDLVGLSYPEAENKLLESGFLLGGVKEAPSGTVPEGMIMEQHPPPGATRDTGTYVYLTTSLGPPPEGGGAGEAQEGSGSTESRHDVPSEALSEEDAVAGAVRGHYQAIGAGNLEEAYSYFGPTFRSQHDQAGWIASERSYEIQSSTIHSLTVEEVLGTTATATVDVSFVDNTGTPRFVIVWGLVKEGGRWKLDEQFSAQRIG